jgi:hypothetical protein
VIAALEVHRRLESSPRHLVQVIPGVDEFVSPRPAGLVVKLEDEFGPAFSQESAHAYEDLPFCALDVDLHKIHRRSVRFEVRIEGRRRDLELGRFRAAFEVSPDNVPLSRGVSAAWMKTYPRPTSVAHGEILDQNALFEMIRGHKPLKLADILGMRFERNHTARRPNKAGEFARDDSVMGTNIGTGPARTNERFEGCADVRLIRSLFVDAARERSSKRGPPKPTPQRRRGETPKCDDESPHKAGYRIGGEGCDERRVDRR